MCVANVLHCYTLFLVVLCTHFLLVRVSYIVMAVTMVAICSHPNIEGTPERLAPSNPGLSGILNTEQTDVGSLFINVTYVRTI